MTAFDKDLWIKAALADGAYAVSKEGAVTRRLPHGSFFLREPVPTRIHKKTGRVILDMRFMGITKTVLLNRLVALAHIPNPLGKPEVNHCNGDKLCNEDWNLEWADRGEQEKHAQANGLKSNRGSQNSNAKLTADAVMAIRASTEDPKQLAITYGVSPKTIRDVIDRKAWTHL